MSMKNSNDTIENRSRDLPACSAVPQPTAPPLAAPPPPPPFQLGSAGIARPNGNLGARWGGGGWGLSTTLRGRLTSGNDPVPMVQEAGLATGSVHPVANTCLNIDLDNIPALVRMG
jgi:hypothetical protein